MTIKDKIYEIVSNPHKALNSSRDYRLFADSILEVNSKNKNGFLIKTPSKVLKPMLEYCDPKLGRELRYKSVKQIENETGFLNKAVNFQGETLRAIYVPRKTETITTKTGKKVEIVYN